MIKQMIEGEWTTKYMFFDGSELSFKREVSGQYTDDLAMPDQIDKGKYSLVISCDVGCNIGCTFCHLTQNNMPMGTITPLQVLENIKDAIRDQTQRFPELKEKAIKLCFMGSGEPFLVPLLIREVANQVVHWALSEGHATYLDGVDIATSYPRINKKKWQGTVKRLLDDLLEFPMNPKQDSRSPLRIFYSLHDSTQEGRNELIPHSRDIEVALPELRDFCLEHDIDFIIHYMFIDGITDSGNHLTELMRLWRKYDLFKFQLRILRYNEGPNGWVESRDMQTILYWLRRKFSNLKVQYSSGKEVKSSCGMFTEYSA